MTAAGRAGMARGSVQPGTVAAAAAAAVSDQAEWSGLVTNGRFLKGSPLADLL